VGIIGLRELRSRRAEPELRRLFNAERAQRAAKRRSGASSSPSIGTRTRKGPCSAARPSSSCRSAKCQAQRAANRSGASWSPSRLGYLAKALWQIRPDPRWRGDDRNACFCGSTCIGTTLLWRFLSAEVINDPGHMMYRVGSDDLARRNGGKRDILAAIA
jgi:hypothetical protein